MHSTLNRNTPQKPYPFETANSQLAHIWSRKGFKPSDLRPGTSTPEVRCPKSVIRNLTSEVQSPKSKVLSPRSEVLNPKSEVPSPMSSFFLFLSVSARKATSLCAVHLSRLSAFDQKKTAFPKLSPKCQTSISRQSHLRNRSIHVSSYASSSGLATAPFAEPK